MSLNSKPLDAWSRRRAGVLAEAEDDERDQEAAVLAEAHAALAEKPEEEVLAELDLPNPDEMKAGDDFSTFMKSTIPSALRNRALRKLWLTDPVLANVDMLVDYGEDFTVGSNPLGVIKTIYRVGKGMLPDEVEEDNEAPDQVEASEADLDHDNEMEPLEAAPEIVEVESETNVTVSAPHVSEPSAPPLAPQRRMRFYFGDGEMLQTTETGI